MVNLLDTAAQNLDQYGNTVRIKKLIFGACRNTWENDQGRLAQLELKDLIQELYERNPTLEHLKFSLASVVQTLNKKSEYSILVHVITSNLERLYVVPEELTQCIVNQDSVLNSELAKAYNKVTQELEQNENAARIKKLVYGACKSTWENDQDKLNRLSLRGLVQELHELAPTLDYLKSLLNSVISTLNKQTEYTLVGDIVSNKFKVFYSNQNLEQQSSENQPFILTAPVNLHETNQPSKPYDLFEIRLEVMKYTNPLRAKILIFSTLHHLFTFNEQDWLLIRTHHLDDLLKAVLESCKTFANLENTLYSTAKALKEPDQNAQVAGAIARIMKPFYPNSNSDINAAQTFTSGTVPERTRMHPIAETTQMNSATANELPSSEETCQFLSFPTHSSGFPTQITDEDERHHFASASTQEAAVKSEKTSNDKSYESLLALIQALFKDK